MVISCHRPLYAGGLGQEHRTGVRDFLFVNVPKFGNLEKEHILKKVRTMAKNTSVSLGDHFENFVDDRVKAGRFSSASDAVRAGLRLLEQEETKLDLLRETLARGERQLDQGQGIDGETAFSEMIG